MNKLTPSVLLTGVCLALLALGCRSPQTRVDQHVRDLHLEWQTNLAHQAALPERVVHWNEAVALLLENNLKLRAARVEVTNSQEAVRQIYRDLTPTLSLRAGISKRLQDISAVTFDDVTFNADSFFNIPGLVSFGARLYTTKLFRLRSETAYELARREQVIELYRLFWAALEAQENALHREVQRSTARAFAEVDPFTGQMMWTEAEVAALAGRQEVEAIQQRASELLGSHAYRWVFSTEHLPELRYDIEPLPLADTSRVAQLQTRLLAIELEAARMQLLGLKMRYWPELTLFVSSPPIYQRSLGRDRFWDAGEVRASADLFWYLDTRGQIARQVRQTRRQQGLQRQRLREESLSLIDRLLLTQELIKHTQEQSERLNQQLEILRAVPPAQNYASLHKYATDYRAMVEQQRRVRQELAQLNTLFWFVDEQAWRDVPAQVAQGEVPAGG
jgi:hypothetical protein